VDKKQPTETDSRSKFIAPALVGSSVVRWNAMTQLREDVFFTKGRVIVRGKTVRRDEAKKADYILYPKPGMPIAVIEAKDNNHSAPACGRRLQAKRRATTSSPTQPTQWRSCASSSCNSPCRGVWSVNPLATTQQTPSPSPSPKTKRRLSGRRASLGRVRTRR
jgi:hypothetical protein